jgi:hypothetical protein
MFYDDFLSHETIVYVKTNLSKKQLHHFRKKITEKSFYPIHIIKEDENDTQTNKKGNLRESQKRNKELFLTRYSQVANKQFGTNSLFEIKDYIKQCPFCKEDKLIISHDYSRENTDGSLFLKCLACNQCLDSKQIIRCRALGGDYEYSEEIEKYFNYYCSNYKDKNIENKIHSKLRKVELVGFQYCQ